MVQDEVYPHARLLHNGLGLAYYRERANAGAPV